MINVKDGVNVKGDGVHNDQPGLQALIDNKVGALYFPPGRYRINSTLTFPFKTGYHVVGSGLPKPVLDGSSEQGAESVLVWGGSEFDKPMVEIQGVGLVWSGLGLWGANTRHVNSSSSSSSSTTNPLRAQYGILIKKPIENGGLGTGQIRVDSILVADCDTAIGTDDEVTQNCDNVGFGYCWIENCEIGLHMTHHNVLKYMFQYIRAKDVTTIIKANNGGKLYTQCVSVLSSGTTVLDLLGGGQNNAYYQLGGVTLKPGIQQVYLLKDAVGTGARHVRLTDGHFGDADTSPTTEAFIEIDRSATAGGLSTAELVGCRGVGALAGRVKVIGAKPTAKALFFARDCDIANVDDLIATPASDDYIAYGIDNWTFAAGYVGNSQSPP